MEKAARVMADALLLPVKNYRDRIAFIVFEIVLGEEIRNWKGHREGAWIKLFIVVICDAISYLESIEFFFSFFFLSEFA